MNTTERFRQLHEGGTFVMPNPWDLGSARLLVALGFPALATTSSGHAASLGKHDQQVTRDQLLEHTTALADAVDVPLSVDAERCFADSPDGVAETVGLLVGTGAAGCSIEDFDPATGLLDPLHAAADRVEAAAGVAAGSGFVLTARCEGLLYGFTDLDGTIERLIAYREAGADVLYAPGPTDPSDIARIVGEVAAPVNVLARRRGPSISDLTTLGVRRVSVGGSLAKIAYAAMISAARDLLTDPGGTDSLSVPPDDDPFQMLS